MPLRGDLTLRYGMPCESHQIGGFAGQGQSPCLQARHIKQVLGEFIQAYSGLAPSGTPAYWRSP